MDTLQGTIWRATQQSTNTPVVIKITSKKLTSESIVIVNGQKYEISENILTERKILKHLSNDKNCPQSITKYIDFMKSNVNYYLIMQDGGHSLFEFNVKVHQYIESGKIDISEWHKLVKIIFKQMVECLEFMHSKRVCHFDVSLENILLNDIDVTYKENQDKLIFCYDDDEHKENSVQAKLCDFGLAEYFEDKQDPYLSTKFAGKACYQSPEITIMKHNFDAASNDIWCLSVCLFMLITGLAPFRMSSIQDQYFNMIINENGDITKLMTKWNKLEYINDDLIELFKSLFQFESDRIDIDGIKKCKWLNSD